MNLQDVVCSPPLSNLFFFFLLFQSWVEMDPEDILAAVTECIDKAIKRFEMMGRLVSDIKGTFYLRQRIDTFFFYFWFYLRSDTEYAVAAIGITNQRETALVWDRKTGKSLHSAIVWSDTRTHDIVKDINKDKDRAALIRDVSGLPVTTYFSAVKFKWLLENVPAVQTAANSGDAMFGTVDSWLMYNLTGGAANGGVHVTDVTNAVSPLLPFKALVPKLAFPFSVSDVKKSPFLTVSHSAYGLEVPKVGSSIVGHLQYS